MSLADVKKGGKVVLHLFTGAVTGIKTVDTVSKGLITITRSDGTKMRFSAKTGKQVDPEPKRPRFANYITEDDGTFVSSRTKGKATKEKRKKEKDEKPKYRRKKAKPEPEEEFNEDDYKEEE